MSQILATEGNQIGKICIKCKRRDFEDGNTSVLHPKKQRKSIFLLLLFITTLFALEGFTTSLFGNTLPLLLAEKRSGYTDTGIMTLTQLPFSLKFLIAPFIDTYYIPFLGRRKTYLSISTLLIGIIFILVAPKITMMMKGDQIGILFAVGFLASLCTAVYDVALQGWVIKVVSPDRFAEVSSCQLIDLGTTVGQIFGFYGLIPLSSKEFLATEGKPIVKLHNVMTCFGIFVTVFSIIWFILIREHLSPEELRLKGDVQRTFLTFKGFLKNPNLRTYTLILLGQSIGFGAIEAVFRYVLVKKGYPKEEFTIVNGYLTPLTIVGTAIATKFTHIHKELTVYLFGKIIRLFKFFYMIWYVYSYNSITTHTMAFLGLNFAIALKNIESSIRRTAIISFDYRIAERTISATYLAILVSIVNLAIILSDGLYPILLDYIDLSVTVSFGTLYNIFFLLIVWRILMNFQKKDSEEY